MGKNEHYKIFDFYSKKDGQLLEGFEPRSYMIYFMISHFHSVYYIHNRLKEEKGGSRGTNQEAIAIIQGREYGGQDQDDRRRDSK